MVSLLLLCACLVGLVAASPDPEYLLEHADIHFERFIQDYGKQYVNEQEKQFRFLIFKENLEKAIRMNERSTSAVFGVTQFMDLTVEEFHKDHTGLQKTSPESGCSYANDKDIENYGDAPASFDWRDQGVVTPVKNQHSCGGCYSFSTIGNLESQYAIKYKKQIQLSEQQIIDCDTSNHGCGGGFMTNALRYLIEAGGAEGEADYPYKEANGQCAFDASKVRVKVADCRAFNLTSQEGLKQLLYNNGPLSIAVKGAGVQFYKGGIMTDQECDIGHLSHAVLLVGYGVSEKGEEYWIVKNSYGTVFGEEGYFRVHRGEGADSCGMMNESMCTGILA